RGLGPVGLVPVLALPEEALAHHEPGQRIAVLALGHVGELLAERLIAWIVQRRRHRNGDRLVRLDRSLGGSLRGWRLRSARLRPGLRRPGRRKLVGPRLLGGGRNHREQRNGQAEGGTAGQKGRHGTSSGIVPRWGCKYPARLTHFPATQVTARR